MSELKQILTNIAEETRTKIIPDNIKEGVTIFGVEGALNVNGIDTSDATATPEDILKGKTAYVNGELITGTIEDYGGSLTDPDNATTGNITNVVVSSTEPEDDNRKQIWFRKIDDSISLCDTSSLITGYVLTDGTFSTDDTNDAMRTDYIEVSPSTTYLFEIVSSEGTYEEWYRFGLYNESNTFIKALTYTNTPTRSIKFTTTSTTQYVVLSSRNLKTATHIRFTPYVEEGISILNDNNEYEKLSFIEPTMESEIFTLRSTTPYVYYRKRDNVVEVNIMHNNSGSYTCIAGNEVLGTLPEGYRPTKDFSVPVFTRTTSGAYPNYIMASINVDGEVSIYNWSSSVAMEALLVTITFLV